MKPKISTALPLLKLKTCAPDHIDLAVTKTWFEDKEVAEEIKVGADPKEGFRLFLQAMLGASEFLYSY